MRKYKDWLARPQSILALLIVGWGVADMLTRLTPLIAIPLDILLIFIGVLILIKEYEKGKGQIVVPPKINDKINPNVSKIKSPEPPNRLPVFFDVVLLILTGIVFVGATYEIIFMSINKANFNMLGLFFFAVCFIGAPVLVWVDVFYWGRKHLKSGESYVVAKTSFIYTADNVEVVFNRCYKVISIMGTDTPDLTPPRLLVAPLNHCKITVKIRRIKEKTFKIDVSSDAERIEIRFDYGRNKRNINTFKKLMLSNEIKDDATNNIH